MSEGDDGVSGVGKFVGVTGLACDAAGANSLVMICVGVWGVTTLIGL